MSPARARFALACLSGAGMALAQPPLGLWPALLPAGFAYFRLWRLAQDAARPGRAVFFAGWLSGFVFFALTLHWIIEPFLVEPERWGWMAPFALVFMAGGLALFHGAGFWLAFRARRVIAGPLAPALGLAAGEFARSYVLTGFPWALPAYAWTGTPASLTAALTGPYGLSLITLAAMFCAGALADLKRMTGRSHAALIIGLAPLPALTLFSALTWPEPKAADGPVIRILQTDIDQRDKWRRDQVQRNFEHMLALSAAPAAERPAMVLWPESAVAFPLDQSPEALRMIESMAGGAALGIGSLRLAAGPQAPYTPGAKWRNSFFLIDGAGLSAPYDKIHLVPFGEYVPFAGLINLAGLAQTGGGIVPGAAHRLMQSPGLPAFSPLICYEIIFPRETARAAKGAKWLAVVTNDAWFGDWAGPAQHLAIARMRAIETGLPVARSANWGYSAMISPDGRLTLLPPGQREGAIDARLPAAAGETIYGGFGETPAFLTALLFFWASFYCRSIK